MNDRDISKYGALASLFGRDKEKAVAQGLADGLKLETEMDMHLSTAFTFTVAGMDYKIPARVYYEPVFPQTSNSEEYLIANCIFSRHYSGHIRERAVKALLSRQDSDLAVAYMFASMADYVPEIKSIIPNCADDKLCLKLTEFLTVNQGLFEAIEERVISYSDSYKGAYKHHSVYRFLQRVKPASFNVAAKHDFSRYDQ